VGGDLCIVNDEAVENTGLIDRARHSIRPSEEIIPIRRYKEIIIWYATTIELINSLPINWAGRHSGQQQSKACHNSILHYTLPKSKQKMRKRATKAWRKLWRCLRAGSAAEQLLPPLPDDPLPPAAIE
jgi:hypothetical protein